VYQRGEEENRRKALLDVISVTNNQGHWSEHDAYVAIWDEVHDDILQRIEKKLSVYVDQWLKSDAGEAFRLLVRGAKYNLTFWSANNSRDKKQQKPILHTSHFLSFKAVEKGVALTGIPWGIHQIYDIFSDLAMVSEVAAITVMHL
jgi:hypothetical protein